MHCKELVIDASVGRSSGGPKSSHPTAKATRDFLSAMLRETCHKVVMTPAIREEWNKHQSRFAKIWRSSMVARKRLRALDQNEREDLRLKIQANNASIKEIAAMLKDVHLIEAALTTDSRIISSDTTARNFFAKASSSIPELRPILWVNPVFDSSGAIMWLKKGAGDDRKWHLYAVSDTPR